MMKSNAYIFNKVFGSACKQVNSIRCWDSECVNLEACHVLAVPQCMVSIAWHIVNTDNAFLQHVCWKAHLHIVHAEGRSDASDVHVHERKGFSNIVDTYCVLVLELVQQNRHKHPGA